MLLIVDYVVMHLGGRSLDLYDFYSSPYQMQQNDYGIAVAGPVVLAVVVVLSPRLVIVAAAGM
jgi:hypothetical protein